MNNVKEPIFLCVLLLILFAASLNNIERPLTQGHKGYGTGIFLHIGHNYEKDGYGLLGAKWNVAWTAETGKETYKYYTHYPAGSFLLYGVVFSVFGNTIIVARLFQTILAALTLILFYYLIKKNTNVQVAMLTTATLLATPLFFFYRDFVQLEFLPLPFGLLVLISYTSWIKSQKKKYLFFTALFAFIGGLFSNWTFYFIGPPIWVHCAKYFTGKNKKLFLLIFPVAFVLSFAIFLLHNQLLTGSVLGHDDNLTGNLFGALLFRMGVDDANTHYGITPEGIAKHLWVNANKYLTPFVLWPAIFCILSLLFGQIKTKNAKFTALIALCLLSSLIPAFLFSNLFWIHPHLIILIFTPFTAFLSGNWLLNLNLRDKAMKHTLLTIFLIGLLWQSYAFYKTQEEQFVDPLVKFLHEHKENVILTFPMNPQAFQVTYYLEKQQVLDVRNIVEFNERKSPEYAYVLVTRDTDAALRELLKSQYEFIAIDEPNQVGAFRLQHK